MARPKILFVREKWAGQPSDGLSDGDGMIQCLESLDLADIFFFYYDEWMALNNNQKPDAALMSLWTAVKPDLVMFTHLLQIGERNVSKSVYEMMRRESKVIGVWHEGAAPQVVKTADDHADCVDFNLFLDTLDQFLIHSKRPEKCFGLYDPRDARMFFDRKMIRDIPVLFLGSLIGRKIRCNGIFGLLVSGIPVLTITGARSNFMMLQKNYAVSLCRAGIALNFSDAGEFRHYKGRVAEACLSGAMLVELENFETPKIMTPYVDYVPFRDPKDLFDKTLYYLQHESERQIIAESGRLRALEKLDGKEFWKVIFEKVGLNGVS